LNNRADIRKKQIITAIENSYGNITVISQRLNCSRVWVYELLKKFKLESAIDDEREKIIDLAENKLINKIKDGDSSMIGLVLKTLGKHRGYVEKQEIGLTGETIKIKLPDECGD